MGRLTDEERALVDRCGANIGMYDAEMANLLAIISRLDAEKVDSLRNRISSYIGACSYAGQDDIAAELQEILNETAREVCRE